MLVFIQGEGNVYTNYVCIQYKDNASHGFPIVNFERLQFFAETHILHWSEHMFPSFSQNNVRKNQSLQLCEKFITSSLSEFPIFFI